MKEPSSEEYARIAKGFDAAAEETVSAAKVWLLRMKWGILGVIILLVAAYAAEDVQLRLKVNAGAQVFGSVEIQPYYAIRKKNGKVEYAATDPSTAKCVNSVFPHFGLNPCWYVRQHRHPIVEI